MNKNGITGGGRDSIDLAAVRLTRNTNEMIHAEIRALYNYWEALRGQRPCPYRSEVDPRDMEGDARHLFLLENLGDGNVRFRLSGSALEEAIGFDLRGMSARTIMTGKARESFLALIGETLAEPGVGYARLMAPDGAQVWEIVLLPLRSDFGKIDRLTRTITLEGELDADARARLLEIADRCPVHRTLTGEMQVVTQLAD